MQPIRAKNEIRAQVVYAGPGFGGKTTNVEYLARQLDGRVSGSKTEGERTVTFDLLTVGYKVVGDWSLRLNLQTVPGQADYVEARRLVLRSPDVVVFVVDSDLARVDANRYALDDVQRVLRRNGQDPEKIPLVLQYNKRDVEGALPLEVLEKSLNPGGAHPSVAAIAVRGIGVVETLGVVLQLVRTSAEARYRPLFETV